MIDKERKKQTEKILSKMMNVRRESETDTNLHAYNMFDINVAGAVVRGVSIMYATTVGNEDATASVMIAPDADQVKISIWPGVSSMI